MAARLPIDVLAFPPVEARLDLLRQREATRWREVEQRARVALFLSIGMFLAWAADVGAAFETGHAVGSAVFGVASVPLAVVVVLAHLYSRWALERAKRGSDEVQQRYEDVTLRQANPLIELARRDPVVAQYLRCVGRQQRALRKLERIALYAWAESGDEKSASRKSGNKNARRL